MNKMSRFILSAFCVVAVTHVFASAAPSVANDSRPWFVSAGISYPFVSDTGNASGNLGEFNSPADYIVGNSALSYTNKISPEVTLGYSFTRYFDLAFMYSQVNANIDSNSILGSGSQAGASAAYSAEVTMNNLIFEPRFIWRNATQWGHVGISPYIAADLGATSVELSNQNVSVQNGVLNNSLSNHSKWNFAWGGELGVINTLSQSIDVTVGVRYLNYGQFNSGTTVTGSAILLKQAVSATLYSIAPFINASYHF